LEEFHFHEGALPAGYLPGFETSLYNQPAHLLLQSAAGWSSFYALNPKHHRIEAAMFFYVSGEEAFSPWRAPFGSVEFSETLPPESLFRFLEYIESRLSALGVTIVTIKNPSQRHAPAQLALLETFLFNLGYQVVDAEVGAVVSVSRDPMTIDDWERRKLRQAREAHLEFREMSMDHLDDVYFFILACRKQKNYSLSMTLADLRKTVIQFQDRYVLFGVFHDDKIVAASIAVRVSSQVLYNFYSDHDRQYDHLSPVVFLLDGMYQYCVSREVTVLDLGTSAIDGKPNFGLLDFKMRLRGQPTAKLTFQKNIAR